MWGTTIINLQGNLHILHIQHALIMRKHSSKDFSLKDRWLMMVELEEKIRFPNFLNLTISEEVFYDCCAGSASKGDFTHTENSFLHKWSHIKQKKIDRIILTINHGSLFCVCSVLYQIMQLLHTRRYISALWWWLFRNWEKKLFVVKSFTTFHWLVAPSLELYQSFPWNFISIRDFAVRNRSFCFFAWL